MRNCRPSSVLPVPVPPWTTVALPRGRPPPSISSSPATPVEARSSGVSGSRDGSSGLRTRGKNVEPVAADLEEVRAGDEVGAAQLDHLDLADGAQLLAAVGEPDDAVGDGELRAALAISSARVFADEEARRAPRRHVDREVVDEGAHRRGVAEEIAQGLEAVDDHQRRLLVARRGR